MSTHLYVHVGPMIKCVGLRPGRNIWEISEDDFDEDLVEICYQSGSHDFHAWINNNSANFNNEHHFNNEPYLFEIDDSYIKNSLDEFNLVFKDHIEKLKQHYDIVRVCFGAISYYL